jgi:hypothetical protein
MGLKDAGESIPIGELSTWTKSRKPDRGLFFFGWRYQDDARRNYLWASSRFHSLVGDMDDRSDVAG